MGSGARLKEVFTVRKLTCAAAGYAAGIGTALWLRSKVRRTVEKYTPVRVQQAVAARSQAAKGRARQAVQDASQRVICEVRLVADEVRGAVVDGRDAMRRTEDDLKSPS